MLALAMILIMIAGLGVVFEGTGRQGNVIAAITGGCGVVGMALLALSDVAIPGAPWSILAAVVIAVAVGASLRREFGG